MLLHLSLESIQERIDLFLDKTGLWQGAYTLYSPDVDDEIIRLSAKIKYHESSEVNSNPQFKKHKNKKKQIWQSADPSVMTPLQKKRNFRMMMYYDEVRKDQNDMLWEPLAEYLLNQYLKTQMQHNQPTPPIAQISLYRHWINVNRPPEITKFFDKVELDYEAEDSYRFYTLKYDINGLKYGTDEDD